MDFISRTAAIKYSAEGRKGAVPNGMINPPELHTVSLSSVNDYTLMLRTALLCKAWGLMHISAAENSAQFVRLEIRHNNSARRMLHSASNAINGSAVSYTYLQMREYPRECKCNNKYVIQLLRLDLRFENVSAS